MIPCRLFSWKICEWKMDCFTEL